MKKLLIVPALLLSTATFAKEYKYELSPMIGYNIAEGNLGLKDDGYLTGGLEFQFNSPGSKISPEFSIYYAPSVDYDAGGDTNVVRGAFNGVYDFEKSGMFKPFVKAGVGLENFSDNAAGNNNGLFFDAGAGAKVAFTKNLALKLEAIYMAKINNAHAGNADSNLMTLVGLTYSFGAMAQKEAPVVIEEEEVVAVEKPVEAVVIVPVAVEKDSDGDGIYDKLDRCPNTPANSTVGVDGCVVVFDDDHDGVSNAADKCPNTPLNTKVDASGCDIDMDHDGVLNAQDICPDTPLGEAVNSDGCPKSIDLHINFENNSYKIKEASMENVKKYADFLKKYTNYSAKIVGYTDDRGAASYNQKLSEKRANEVKRALISLGVNPAQLSAMGKGEANPVATNATKEGRAQNRRIEAELTRN